MYMNISESGCRQFIMKKYNMTEKSMQDSVSNLRQWLDSNPSIIRGGEKVLSDQWLENQLLMNKNNLERTKSSIEAFCKSRMNNPKLYCDRDIENNSLQLSFDSMSISYLPGLTSSGYKICLVRIENPDHSTFDIFPIMRRALMIVDYFLLTGYYFSGIHLIFDLKNLRAAHLTRLSLSAMTTMASAMKAYPVSYTKVSLINYPGFISKAVAIFRPFMSTKIMSRVIMHKSLDSLYQMVPQDVLPSDYFGSGKTQKEYSGEWKEKLLTVRDQLLKIDNLSFDESKRKSSHCADDVNDPKLYDSFKKLIID